MMIKNNTSFKSSLIISFILLSALACATLRSPGEPAPTRRPTLETPTILPIQSPTPYSIATLPPTFEPFRFGG